MARRSAGGSSPLCGFRRAFGGEFGVGFVGFSASVQPFLPVVHFFVFVFGEKHG